MTLPRHHTPFLRSTLFVVALLCLCSCTQDTYDKGEGDYSQMTAELADAHVERYLQRGFTSLMFSFGCTGGQHRSVYSAQHLAEHIHEKYGIEVRICHREQGINQVLK